MRAMRNKNITNYWETYTVSNIIHRRIFRMLYSDVSAESNEDEKKNDDDDDKILLYIEWNTYLSSDNGLISVVWRLYAGSSPGLCHRRHSPAHFGNIAK